METKQVYLRELKIFETLNNSQIEQFSSASGLKIATRNDVITYGVGGLHKIFILLKGKIKIVALDSDGNTQTKEIIHHGDFFGYLDLVEQDDLNEQAIVVSDSVIIVSFLQRDFENLIRLYPEIALRYTKYIGKKMGNLKIRYEKLIFSNARSRLLQFFMDWAAQEGKVEGNTITLENYLTQNDIAQIINTSRPTTVALMRELGENGIVYYSRRKIIIENIKNALHPMAS